MENIKTMPTENNLGCYINLDLKSANKSHIESLKSFANKRDVSTLEFENFDYHLLKEIEKIKPFYPKPEINKIVQNRILEKNFFKSYLYYKEVKTL